MPRVAVHIAVALFADAAATARGVAPAAVHVGLVAIHPVVATGVGNARERERVTRERGAVAVAQTSLTERAARADPTATIFVRLVSVLPKVGALLSSDAPERRELAGFGSAVIVDRALLAHTGRTGAAAVVLGARLSDALSIRIARLAERAIRAHETGHAVALAIAFSAARIGMARHSTREWLRADCPCVVARAHQALVTR